MSNMRLLGSLLELVLSPTKGWEDVALDDRQHPGRILSPQYYILIAVVSLSWIVQGCYHGYGWITVCELVVMTFATFFAGYFLGTFVMSVSLESLVEHGEPDESATRRFVILGLSLLAIILLISNLLPTTTPLLWFLPVYILVILWKGARYLRVNPRKGGAFTIMAFISVLLPVAVLGWLFKLIILR